jgi:hypothetical protein
MGFWSQSGYAVASDVQCALSEVVHSNVPLVGKVSDTCQSSMQYVQSVSAFPSRSGLSGFCAVPPSVQATHTRSYSQVKSQDAPSSTYFLLPANQFHFDLVSITD